MKPTQLFARRQAEAETGELDPPVIREVQEQGGEVRRARRPVRGGSSTDSAGSGSAHLVAERAIIGAVLADNALYEVVIEIVRAEDFADPVAAAAFAAINDIMEGRIEGISSADPITLASLPTLGQSINTLQAWCGSAATDALAVASYAQVVCSAAGNRQLGEAVLQAQSIFKEDLPYEERAASIQQAVAVASDVRALPVVSMGAAVAQALAEMADKAKRGDTGVGMPTGFEELDALLAGLHGGQLIIVAARPGVGKTAFAMSVGLATAHAGFATLMVSMEMKAVQLSKRALAIASGVDSHALRLGALSEADWEAAIAAGEYLATIPFDIVDLPNVTLASLSNVCRRLHRQGKLKLLIVDYLQIMETTAKKNGSREQEVAALSRGLKKLAMALDIPVIALSQLNRAVESRTTKQPQMSDLRESGALEQDADVIVFIHRESAIEESSSVEEMADIIVAKQRDGPTGAVQVGYARRSTRFYCRSAANQARMRLPADGLLAAA